MQFLKHNAADFNIDPTKVAMYGVSAGAVSSLWLAYSPDMADVNAADDSIAGESTSLVAVGATPFPLHELFKDLAVLGQDICPLSAP